MNKQQTERELRDQRIADLLNEMKQSSGDQRFKSRKQERKFNKKKRLRRAA